MSARVVPKSVSMVAQTAPPSSVTVRAGRNRNFFLYRFSKGTSGGYTGPTLGGQAASGSGIHEGVGYGIRYIRWTETAIQSAGIGVNATGSAALTGYSDSGLTETIWCSLTIENVDNLNLTWMVDSGDYTPTDSSQINIPGDYNLPPAFGSLETYWSDTALDYVLMPIIIDPASVAITEAQDSLLLASLAETSYKAFLYETIQSNLNSFRFTLDSDFTNWITFLNKFSQEDPKVSGPELPIHAVQTRSMDAKTIADRYNLGVAKQEDYIFNDRKFYQDGTTS